jgi:hypothetical protein
MQYDRDPRRLCDEERDIEPCSLVPQTSFYKTMLSLNSASTSV